MLPVSGRNGGTNRDSVSRETGLLKTWPKDGPRLIWCINGLGDSVAAVAVVGGRIFVLGKSGDDEQLITLEEATGKQLWSVPVGPAPRGGNPSMRWASPRTPTVDDDRVYAVTARAELACFTTRDGKLLWRKNYAKDFQGRIGVFGCGDRPLVDGENLICSPGGKDSTVALTELGIAGRGLDEGQFVGRGLQVVAEEGGVVSVACGVDTDPDACGRAGRNCRRSRLRSGSVLW